MVVCCGIVGRGACIQSLLVSVLLLVLAFPFLSSREFSELTPHPLHKKRKVNKLISDTAFPNQEVWCMLLTKNNHSLPFEAKLNHQQLLNQFCCWRSCALEFHCLHFTSQLVLKLTSCQYNQSSLLLIN